MIPEPDVQPPAPRESRLPFLALALVAAVLLVARLSEVKIGPPPKPPLHSVEHPPSSAATASDGLMLCAFVLGLFLVVDFLVRRARYLRDSRPPRLRPGSLVLGFLGYLVAYEVLQLSVLSLLSGRSPLAAAAQLALICAAAVCAIWYGLTLVPRGRGAGLSEIGLRRLRSTETLKWGVGGYVAAVPLVYGSLYLSVWLMTRYGIVTPAHPVLPLLKKGAWALAVAIAMIVVFAPVVEEIAFRGLLFGGLRGVMGFWQAALASSLVFALVHPTFPGQFLPILLLGLVLAVIRQSSGSLVPCIVCHALNNLVALIWAILQA